MKVGVDIDGTADLDPVVFQSLLSALKAAGHFVIILTGCSSKHVTQAEVDEKVEYLNSIGLGSCWNKIVVFGDPPHKAKAKYCKKHGLDLCIDNSVKNAQLMSRYCVVLLPWNQKAD